MTKKINTQISPRSHMTILSREEVARLALASDSALHELFRRCALAVLNCGSTQDDPEIVMKIFQDFDITAIQLDRGIKLELKNAPSHAFVDGRIIEGIREMLFSVLRDVIFVHTELACQANTEISHSERLTNMVFDITRNAKVMIPGKKPSLTVCWGGHSISRGEYDYTKLVGYELGLRGSDICTGCGPGAMKGPMKGATIAHAKQRQAGYYIGITEPGIIAAESPNPIVNQLIIMPDIEKRLEAFVRMAHGVIVFPGGVGTCEEILYLLGILLHPDNQQMPFPLILTGPESSRAYFEQVDAFIKLTLGEQAQTKYQIIIDNPVEVARTMSKGFKKVKQFRIENKDAFYFNWMLKIEQTFQLPFEPSHEKMAALNLNKNQPVHELAANLRRAFSGIVAGNVKPQGVKAVRKHGPFEIKGDQEIMDSLDILLKSFVDQHRMKIPDGASYQPCYKLIR